MASRRSRNFGETTSRRTVEKAYLTAKALKMRRAGYSPAEIAQAVPEFSDERQVRKYIRAALSEVIAEPAQELIALQFSRYERLIRSIWRLALSEDLQAHDRVLKLIEAQSKLMRLGQGAGDSDQHSDVEKWLAGLVGEFTEAESDDIADDL